MKMLEKDLEKKVVAYAKSKGCLCYKFTSPAHRAVPDRIIVTPEGVVGFLELKRPGNRPTPLQERELSILARQGCVVNWCDDLTSAQDFINSLLTYRLQQSDNFI